MKSILRPKQLAAYLSVSLTTVWRLEKLDGFPKKIHVSTRAVGWLEQDIDSWIKSRTNGELDNLKGGSL